MNNALPCLLDTATGWLQGSRMKDGVAGREGRKGRGRKGALRCLISLQFLHSPRNHDIFNIWADSGGEERSQVNDNWITQLGPRAKWLQKARPGRSKSQ